MAFRRIREAWADLTDQDAYETPREQIEQYLPGMDHLHHEETNHPGPTPIVLLAVGTIWVVPASTFLGKLVTSLFQAGDGYVVTAIVGWINTLIAIHCWRTVAAVIPLHRLNPVFEPFNILGVRRIREAIAALRRPKDAEELQQDP